MDKANLEKEINKVIFNEYVMPKYYEKNINKSDLNYLNYIDAYDILRLILNHDKTLIERLSFKLRTKPKFYAHVVFDKKINEPCIEVSLKIKDKEIFNDKVYQYYTESGLKYEKETGKVSLFDKDLYKIINTKSLENGRTDYKENLMDFHKKLIEEEYKKRLNNINDLTF